MAAQPLEVTIKADTTELEASYAKIKALEEERAARAAILTENTLKIRKKALREEEEVLQTLIASNSKNAEGQAEIDKKREESIKKIKELKNEVDKLTPATEKVTFAQEQLGKSIKRVQATLRGFAITAAIAFGAAILKGVIDFAKGLFEASKATQAINAAMEEFAQEAGKALGKMREQFTELKKLTPGTLAWKNEIEKVNKQYGDMIKLGIDATLGDIEAAERLLTASIREQIKEQVRRDALAKAFGDVESARLELDLARRKENIVDIADATVKLGKLEEVAKELEAALEPTAFQRALQEIQDQSAAAAETTRKIIGKVNDEADKAGEKRKQLAQKAADEIAANFEQAAKAIQALEDEIEKAEIEGIDDKHKRDIALADFELKIAKRNAEDTITNKQQLDTFIEGLERQHQIKLQEIRDAFRGGGRVVIPPAQTPEGELTLELNEFFRKQADQNAKDTITNENELKLELLRNEEIYLLSKLELIDGDGQAEVELRAEINSQIIENQRATAATEDEIRKARQQKIIDDLNKTASAFSQTANSFSALYNQLTAKDRAFAEAEIERINKTIEGEEAREKAILNVERNLARETEKFAVFAKTAALFEILASQATTIANIVQMAGNVGAASGVAGPVTFAITLAAGLATTIANFAAAKSILDGAPLPKFAEGTSATHKGWAVVGERGPEIIKTGKGDSVFNNKAVRTERELIDAINDGTINDLIMRQYVYPAIMAHQVAQKARDKQELKETVSAYFDNAFDDTNLQRIGDRQISILKGIYSRLKPKATPATRSRF